MLKQMMKGGFLLVVCCLSTAGLAADKSKAASSAFVETATVQEVVHADQVSSTGTLVSIPGIVVRPEISGRITKIYFKSGDVVQSGAPLIEINPDVVKAQVVQAQAELRLNKLNFDRSFALYQSHDISKSDFDKSQSDYISAKAKVESAQAQLRQTNIVAAFAGKLGLSQVNIGDYVNAGQSVVNLQTLDPLKVDFSIPEICHSKIAVGQQVSLRTDAYPQESFIGTVEAVESLVNQNNRTLNIRANVPNEKGKLIPGGFVEVSLKFADRKLIMIPQTSLVYSLAGNYVYKVVGGKAEKVAVTLGEKDSNNVVVKSGLSVGDVVVTTGQLKVHPGADLIVVENKKEAS